VAKILFHGEHNLGVQSEMECSFVRQQSFATLHFGLLNLMAVGDLQIMVQTFNPANLLIL